MSFDLAFWHEDHPITVPQALQVYWQLCEGNVAVVKPSQALASFLQNVAQRYPPIEATVEEHLDVCPWSCEWSLTPGSAIFCMTWPCGRELASLLIQMATQYDLVCYDPQRDEVHLPPSLLAF